MSKLIELAQKNGATRGMVLGKHLFTDDQLEAFAAELVKPYVEALEKYRKDEMDGLGAVFNTRAKEALADHREMFGEQE